MSKKILYSWDSTVFIAWLGEDQNAPLADIDLVAREIDNDKANFLVTVAAYAEILDAKHKPEKMKRFREFLQRSNVIVADTTMPIADRAGKLRSDGVKEHRKIRNPDAIFVATAVIYKADVFHTLDKQLLGLNGNKLVDGLLITKPQTLTGGPALPLSGDNSNP